MDFVKWVGYEDKEEKHPDSGIAEVKYGRWAST